MEQRWGSFALVIPQFVSTFGPSEVTKKILARSAGGAIFGFFVRADNR
jgi:hypothetical protein